MKKGEFDRAIEDYDQSIEADPNYARAFNNRGVAYQKKGEHGRALEDLNKSIKLDPRSPGVFANRAEYYRKNGEYDRALRDYDEALRIQPAAGGSLERPLLGSGHRRRPSRGTRRLQ